MSIFGSIMDKIFHHPTAASAPAQASEPSAAPPAQSGSPAQGAAPAAQAAPTQPVNVELVLQDMAQERPGDGGNWRTSIVDLLKLLGLDSSLEARKQLAQELGVNAGAAGSAEENMALQKAVMAKLAANGGIVPDSLRNAA